MRIYEYAGGGLALGAVVIVTALRADQALRLAKRWAEDNGVNPETIKLIKIREVKSGEVVYGWNGDY